MAYTNIWTTGAPLDTQAANQGAVDFRATKLDVMQRIASFGAGLFINRPTPEVNSITANWTGVMYWSTDTNQVFRWNGTTWDDISASIPVGTLIAQFLATTGAPVDVKSAAPPTAGQALVATDATHSTWQTLASSPIVLKYSDTSVVTHINPISAAVGNTITIPGGTLQVGSIVLINARASSGDGASTNLPVGTIKIGSYLMPYAAVSLIGGVDVGAASWSGSFIVTGSSTERGSVTAVGSQAGAQDGTLTAGFAYPVADDYDGTDPISGDIIIRTDFVASGAATGTFVFDYLSVVVFV